MPSPVSAEMGIISVNRPSRAHDSSNGSNADFAIRSILFSSRITGPRNRRARSNASRSPARHSFARIDHHRQHVDSLQRLRHFPHHLPSQSGVGALNSRRVDQHHLRPGTIYDAQICGCASSAAATSRSPLSARPDDSPTSTCPRSDARESPQIRNETTFADLARLYSPPS